MISRQDKADEGNPQLAPFLQEMIQSGVMSIHTQPGGVAFNDEVATFLVRFRDDILKTVERRVVDALKVVADGGTGVDVDAVIAEIVARLEG